MIIINPFEAIRKEIIVFRQFERKIMAILEGNSIFRVNRKEICCLWEARIGPREEEMNFGLFLEKYPLYPFQASLCYKIYKDISLKREVTDLELVDGATIHLPNSYFLKGKIFNSDSERLYIPIHVDSEVDLEW
jgi:hypothetical protein